jgi:hypothetical protein
MKRPRSQLKRQEVNKMKSLTASPLREKLLPRAVILLVAVQLIVSALVSNGG